MLLPTFPLWTRAVSPGTLAMEIESMNFWDKVDVCQLKNYLFLSIAGYWAFYILWNYVITWFIERIGRNARELPVKMVISRSTLRCIYIPIFLLQLAFAHAPLEYHFIATIFILYLNIFTVQYIPELLSSPNVQLRTLDDQYVALEGRDQH